MAIAGCLGFFSAENFTERCSAMLMQQHVIGHDGDSLRLWNGAVFGRSLRRILPEDIFDLQPLVARGEGLMLVSDIRIDNRTEVLAALGLSRRGSVDASDATVLLAAWERWGEAAVDRVIGDFAAAVWTANRELLLIRSALATRPLFYHLGPEFTAFATMPQALHATGVPPTLDHSRAAAFVVGLPLSGETSIYAGISRVEQGQIVRISQGRAQRSVPWRPTRTKAAGKRLGDLADGLTDALDTAVGARLRRASGQVAAHLSSGRDSSAVATTAARLLSHNHEELIAFTAAPRADFRGGSLPGWIADEADLAATTARRHQNMRHVVSRTNGELDLSALGESNRLSPDPLTNLTAYPWWERIDRGAREGGATVLLTGEVGNLALSAGGNSHLVDLAREDGLWTWARTCVRVAGVSARAWRSVLHGSIGPLLPRSAHALAQRSILGIAAPPASVQLLRAPYQARAEEAFAAYFGETRPPKDHFEFRSALLQSQDLPNTVSLASHGVEPRDPTADRRLVDYCFSLPVEALVGPGGGRPVFDLAMKDRIPPEVLASRRRGYQGADWQDYVNPLALRRHFDCWKRHPLVADLLNVEEIDRLIDGWPRTTSLDYSTTNFYRNDVLRALSMANFIVYNFPFGDLLSKSLGSN